MKYTYTPLNWFFGIAFLLSGMSVVSEAPLAGLSYIAISAILLPPARNFVHSKTGKTLSSKAKAIGIFGLFIAAHIFMGINNVKKAEALALQEAAESQKQTEYFIANKPKILNDLKAAIKAEDYQKAFSLSSKYLAAKDAELSALNSEAKTKLDKQIAEEQEAVERQKKIESQFSSWDGSHQNLEQLIKESMNDPDSYQHVETVYNDHGDYLIVTTTFRGKNAFGGVVKNTVKAKVTLGGNVLQILSQN